MELCFGNLPLFGALMTWLHPLWMVAVGAAVAVAALIAAYKLLQWILPKIAAIAVTTAKEAISQPLFFVVLAVGGFALILFPFVPYNTFGEDVKIVKDTGLTWIIVWAMFLGLWTASKAISEEIEGRTALTLLSKPIGRCSFLIGKFLGVIGPVVIVLIVLGALFLGSVSYKVVYDARENCQPEPTAQDCRSEMFQILPGLVLALLETVVLVSISVAISTRLPMLANLIICVSVYVLGHLVPLLVSSSVGQFEIVSFVGTLLAVVLPVLDHFNIYAAISTGKEVPWSYVGWAFAYCLLYSSAALLVGLLAFEDRDLG